MLNLLKISKWPNSMQIITEKSETKSKDQKNLHNICPDFGSVLACTETIELIKFFLKYCLTERKTNNNEIKLTKKKIESKTTPILHTKSLMTKN